MGWGFLKKFAFWTLVIDILKEIGILKQKKPGQGGELPPEPPDEHPEDVA